MGGCSKLFFKVVNERWQSSVHLKAAFFCVKACSGAAMCENAVYNVDNKMLNLKTVIHM